MIHASTLKTPDRINHGPAANDGVDLVGWTASVRRQQAKWAVEEAKKRTVFISLSQTHSHLLLTNGAPCLQDHWRFLGRYDASNARFIEADLGRWLDSARWARERGIDQKLATGWE